MLLIGQKSNIDVINTWNKLPNFVIIQGGEHTGKSYMVLYLCQKFNLHYIKIKPTVNNIRSLISIMEPNSNTVYHMDNFDKASIMAKNALLKITEECVPGNYIVITGGPQIKTLESRARKIIMTPYSLEEICEYMAPYIQDVDKQKKLYVCGVNTPAKVKLYKDYEDLDSVMNMAYDTFKQITYISPDYIITTSKQFEDRYEDGSIDKCLLYISMLINLIEHNIKNNAYYSYLDVLNILMQAKSNLQKEPTLRRRMLVFKTLYDIYGLRSDI